ncbi:hypothetical protein Pmani_018501 [Petrolisthes manimaculis]|uniref:Uncharacterized protein n=1 Tax=Petrolisthes manimaculis TaxID=1843537 RepID=A0AAE1PKW3_9EUCA|nr:hypothetical protein Pmani_018501 [Petrolisthes manimaculis]
MRTHRSSPSQPSASYLIPPCNLSQISSIPSQSSLSHLILPSAQIRSHQSYPSHLSISPLYLHPAVSSTGASLDSSTLSTHEPVDSTKAHLLVANEDARDKLCTRAT